MRRATLLTSFALCGIGTIVTGCASSPAGDKSRRMTESERQEFQAAWGGGASGPPRANHAAETAVATGKAPLAYIVQQPARVWVTDDAGRQWGPVAVGSGSAVRVAEATGVAIGARKLADGPLGEGRTYTVHLGSPPDTAWQNKEIEGPKPTFTPRLAEPTK